ncbi:unnamed protein product, partial [Allacma fusca]
MAVPKRRQLPDGTYTGFDYDVANDRVDMLVVFTEAFLHSS